MPTAFIIDPFRTERLFKRPTWPYAINKDSWQARDLLFWYPLDGPPIELVSRSDSSDQLNFGNKTARDATINNGAVFGGMPGIGSGYQFTAASSQYLEAVNPALIAVPLTMAAWGLSRDVTTARAILSINQNNATTRQELSFRGDVANDPIQLTTVSSTGTSAAAASAVGYVADKVYHACGVIAANNSRAVFLNGGAKGTNGTNVLATLVNRVTVGASRTTAGALAQFANGYVGDARIYSRALTDGEVWSLFEPTTRWDLYWTPNRRSFFYRQAETLSVTGSGGLLSAGAGLVKRGFKPTATGGATSGGAGLIKNGFTAIASGGSTTGGATTPIRGAAPKGSGGSQASGTTIPIRGAAPKGSGGSQAGGSASFLVSAHFPGGGTIASGGSASWRVAFSLTPSGGATTGGTTPPKRGFALTPTGGLETDGTTAPLRGVVLAPSGGVATGGVTLPLRGVVLTPTGGLDTAGAADIVTGGVGSLTVIGAGGAILAGAGSTRRSAVIVATGSASTGGHNEPRRGFAVVAVGGAATSGTAAILRGLASTGVGGLQTAGTATVVKETSFVAEGGLSTGGDGHVLRGRIIIATGDAHTGGAATIVAIAFDDLMAPDVIEFTLALVQSAEFAMHISPAVGFDLSLATLVTVAEER